MHARNTIMDMATAPQQEGAESTSITPTKATVPKIPYNDKLGKTLKKAKMDPQESAAVLRAMLKAARSEEDVAAVIAAAEELGLSKKDLKEPEIYRRGEFDPDFLNLYMNDPFLGGMSMEISKVVDFKMPTAYIGVRPNGKSHEIIMGLNPNFLRPLPSKQRQGVFKHEIYHMVFQHIFTRAIGEKSYQVLWNWATDLAINSIIGKENLPEMCLIPGEHPIDPQTGKPIEGPYGIAIKNFKPMLSSDYYFEELRKIQEQQGDSDLQIALGSGMGTMDDHGKWADLDPEIQDQIRDKVRGMIEQGVRRADKSNDWGTIPQEIAEKIRALVSREIDWRSIVRNFIGRCRTMERTSTIRKVNKKMPYIHPGVKRPLRANFACFIDQSGSMSDEDIAMLFGELESFAQETTLDVYHFDTELDIKSHTVWKRGAPFPPAHRTRCGGTDFQCVADFCNTGENRGKWSGVVILTDGYAPQMGAINGARTLWVITEDGTMDTVRPGDLAIKMKQEKQFKSY